MEKVRLMPFLQKLTALLVSVLFASTVVGSELKPFTSDGCSGFPNGTWSNKNLWLDCCTAHDLAYWQGGTHQQRVDADIQLKQCVQDIGETAVSYLMLFGVSIGGSPIFPSSFRWGYGWPYQRFYQALTPQELEQVKQLLDSPH